MREKKRDLSNLNEFQLIYNTNVSLQSKTNSCSDSNKQNAYKPENLNYIINLGHLGPIDLFTCSLFILVARSESTDFLSYYYSLVSNKRGSTFILFLEFFHPPQI